MKVLFIITILFLAACTQSDFSSNQKVTDLNKTVSVPEKINNVINQTIPKNISQPKINQTVPSSVKATYKREFNGTSHIIEVLDATEDGKGCLIRVDGTTTLINEDETQTVNGVKIHVTDVVLLRSYLEDKDACQIIISNG